MDLQAPIFGQTANFMKVYKFGGASVKSAEAFENVSEIINQQNKLVVVISALGKTTNKLETVVNEFYQQQDYQSSLKNVKSDHLKIAEKLFDSEDEIWQTIETIFGYMNQYLANSTPTEYDEIYDQVVPAGELLSSKILSAVLTKNGITNTWVDVRKVLRTDESFRKASINWEESTELAKNAFSGTDLFITQGFIGGTHNSLMTTLGREGSDFSAAALANMLDAKSLTVWKDVDGVLNADPRYFNQPQLIANMSYKEAIELSFYGATIIHPKTIKPLENKSIPLFVKCFNKPKAEGSIINSDTVGDGLKPIYIYKPDQMLISISRKDFGFIEEQHISKVFDLLHKNKSEVNIMQNSALNFSICVDYNPQRSDQLIAALQQDFKVLYNQNLELLTIRHGDSGNHKDLIKNHEVVIEQRTRSTQKFLLRNLSE